MKEKKYKLGFIGLGNMGEAILKALLEEKVFRAKEISFYEADTKKKKQIMKRYGIHPASSNAALSAKTQTLLLAVKPQSMNEVLGEIATHLDAKSLVVSIAAGLDLNYFRKRCPSRIKIIRAMPNLGLIVGKGATALFAPTGTKKSDQKIAASIFSSAGLCVWVSKEKDLDAVTALSGSGPGFLFAMMRALLQSAAEQGLSAQIALPLITQTFEGAAAIVKNSKDDLTTWVQRVASKGGTTEAGLAVLANHKFDALISRMIAAATQRAEELRCTS